MFMCDQPSIVGLDGADTPIPNFSELVLLMHHIRSIIKKPILTEIEAPHIFRSDIL